MFHTNPTNGQLEDMEIHRSSECVETLQNKAASLVHEVHQLTEKVRRSDSAHFAERSRERLQSIWRLVEAKYAEIESLADTWRGLHSNMHLLMTTDRLNEYVRQAHERNRRLLAAAPAVQPPAPAPAVQPPAVQPPEPVPAVQPTSVDALIHHLTNDHQIAALRKLESRSESELLYLNQYVANTDHSARMRDVEGTFSVFGSMRSGSREAYSIKWYKQGLRSSFWCSCPDHKFNSGKKNMVCKHVCFLVCRVGKIFDPAFFNGNKQFTVEQHAAFAAVVNNSVALSQIPTLRSATATAAATAVPRSDRQEIFRICRKPVAAEDSCPICYDEMENTACLNCPTCSNNVHENCMKVWLENHDTCVYCRSNVWRSF